MMGNASDIDISKIQKEYSELLCPGEEIVSAFAHIRDKWVFTNKRLILQNTQGLTGKKKEYLSIPYHAVEYFSVETSGTFDEDSELKIWVKGMSEPVEVEFGRGQNILAIERMLASFVL